MARTTTELPGDLDPDELNSMIRALSREMGCPNWVYSPDLVELDHIPGHIYGYNRGCSTDGLECYREGQKWRRKLIAELQKRPEWIAEWRAEQDLNRRIRELCERKGLRFMPWECHPANASDELPERDLGLMHMYANSLPEAVKLRRRLISELEAGG
jgi:hypothetical protein